MEGQNGAQGGSRPTSRTSVGSGSVDLTQMGVRVEDSPPPGSRKSVSPAPSIGGFSQIEGMSEETRFKLEMRRMELEEARELKKIGTRGGGGGEKVESRG